MKTPYILAKSDKHKYFELFKELYEHSPWVVERAHGIVKLDVKYDDISCFHELLCSIVLDAPRDLQDSLIQAHPILAGSKAINNKLTNFSTREQESAGLNACNDIEIETFNTLNNKYLERFGFPFIMAVKGESKVNILNSLKKRLLNDPDEERLRALHQINKIAWIRIGDLYE